MVPGSTRENLSMSESDYWLALEFRLCGEFPGFAEKELRRYWCDGISPYEYVLADPQRPRITGRATLVYVQDYQEWKFTLLLPRPVASREEIDWQSLLPPDNMTRWLWLDPFHKRLEIEPGVAVPD